MDKLRIEKLSFYLTIGFVLAITFVVTILIIMHYVCYSIVLQNQIDSRMTNTYNLAKVMVIPLWNNDTNLIRQISEAYQTCEYISGVRVETDLGETLYDSMQDVSSNSLIREEMVRQSDHYFGRLKLQFTREGIDQTLRKTLIIVIIATLPLIMISIIGSHFLIKYFLNNTLNPYNRKC